MPEQDHVKELTKGVDAWNKWRRDNPEIVPDLSGHDFGTMVVAKADFSGADLRDARLGDVVGLLPSSLAGADLTRAELPTTLNDFPELEHVAEVSRHARVNFLAVVASCVFCWLTIAQTSDGQLLSNSGILPLPVINTKVPVNGFFLSAPAILLALYVYLHLYLQRMWDGLSRLPAIFPDGARLDQKAFPWLLSGLINLYVPRLRNKVPPFALPQVILSIVAGWCLVPMTLALFWLRYLLVTDEVGIALHVAMLALALAFGIIFHWRAYETLRGRESLQGFLRLVGRLPAPRIVASLMVLVVSFGAAVAATYGFRNAAFWHLDFAGEAVTGKKDLLIDEIAKLTPLDLTRANFRHAKGQDAILVNVILSDAVDLSSAQFQRADLRMANLQGANLSHANLAGARIDGTVLAGTILTGANLKDVSPPLTKDILAQACGIGGTLPDFLTPCPRPGEQVVSRGKGGSGDARPGDKQDVVQAEGQPAGATIRDCPDCPEMVVILAGSFRMGDLSGDGDGDEKPVHDVTIPGPFAVGKYEVTFAEWDACTKAGQCSHVPGDEGWGRGNRPVINVSWDDIKSYLKWLSARTKKQYRLLSEAEWEYAARAGTKTKYPWGDTASHEQANYGTDKCCSGLAAGRDKWVNTSPVGSFPANAFGLYDMHGNVWEWVGDCWNNTYKGAPTDGGAWTKDGDCSRRVLRGGSWGDAPRDMRSAFRFRYTTGERVSDLGFRVARTF